MTILSCNPFSPQIIPSQSESVPNGFEFGIAETDDEIDELIQFRSSWWTRWSDVPALH